MRPFILFVLLTLNGLALPVAAFAFTHKPWQALAILGFALFALGSAVELARWAGGPKHRGVTGKW